MSAGGIRFGREETRDLLVAWLALGVAFTIFFARGGTAILGLLVEGAVPTVLAALVISLFTAGLGFLLHELAHKVAAIRLDHVAEFRADYSMLFLAVMSALLGFIFAAPGAVHHRGRNVTERENGLIALAGPVVNLLLGAAFIPVLAAGIATEQRTLTVFGARGLVINLFLAGFNMLPFGALDGRTVIAWNPLVWAVMFLPSVVLVVVVFLGGISGLAFVSI